MHSLAILVGAGLDFVFNRLKTARRYNVGRIIVPLTWMSVTRDFAFHFNTFGKRVSIALNLE